MRRNAAFLAALLCAAPAAGRTWNGIDVLEKEKFKALRGAKVALLTNHTGVNRNGVPTLELLLERADVDVVSVLAPEHGMKGRVEHGEAFEDEKRADGLVVHSLYGKTKRPTGEMLAGVDTIVYDIQDVGARFYTYIATMAMAMEEAAERGIRFVVLDRPNPIRGDILEGDVLDPETRRLTGYFPLPVRYGLTPGEVARWVNAVRDIGADVTVVPLRGWKRSTWFSETGLPFVPPSPNIPTLRQTLLYPGIGCFEATNVSVGRGTEAPFEQFGAPWIDSDGLVARLREAGLEGLLFEPVEFIPRTDLYAGVACRGVRIIVTDRARARPFDAFVTAFLYLAERYPDAFVPDWEEVRVVTGSRDLEAVVRGERSLEEYRAGIAERLAAFRSSVRPYLLYSN